MAFASALPHPSLFVNGNQIDFRNLKKLPISAAPGKQKLMTVITKAVSDSSASSNVSIVKSVQNAWSNSEDRIAFAGLGFAGIVAFWALTNLIANIDKLPVVPSVLEFIGILYSSWFTYRYLLFKPDREELIRSIKSSISDVIGQ